MKKILRKIIGALIVVFILPVVAGLLATIPQDSQLTFFDMFSYTIAVESFLTAIVLAIYFGIRLMIKD